MPDNTDWIPIAYIRGHQAFWDVARVVAPIKRTVNGRYYLPLKEDLEKLREALLKEDPKLPSCL